MRYHLSFALLGALTALPACDATTTPELEAGAAPALSASTKTTELPMRGSYEAHGGLLPPAADCAGFRLGHSGGGVETHTGRYTITTTDCVIGNEFTGSFTKVAANGDLLFGTYAGSTQVIQGPSSSSPLLVLEISGTLTFTGGTGRFTGAIGTESMHGRQWIDVSQADLPAHTLLDLEGTITLTHPAQ